MAKSSGGNKSKKSNNSAKKKNKSTGVDVTSSDYNKLLKTPFLFLLLVMLVILVAVIKGERNSDEENEDTLSYYTTRRTTITANYTNNARLLAEFINSGVPIDNDNIQQLQHLINSNTDVLGELVPDETTGYRIRQGSFLEVLKETPPRRIKEDDLAEMGSTNNIDLASLFRRPLLIERSKTKSMSKLAQHVTATKLAGVPDLTVKPSRCSALAFNYGLFDSIIDGNTINPLLRPHDPYYKGVSFSHFLEKGMDHGDQDSSFDLTTTAVDDRNIMVQTHGMQSFQLPHMNLERSMAKNELKHPFMDSEYFPATCINPPALGMAGSLRGLRFHNHPANWNEAVIGRKLWMLYPPRDHENYSSHLCPWPPWHGDQNVGISTMMDTFFSSGKRTPTLTDDPLASCYDQSLTSIQWIVYEMVKLEHKHRPLLFIAHPNELVWIPDGWIHATVNIDDVVHAYRASCSQNVFHSRISNQEAQKDVLELCKETGNFCPNRDEYCHSYCSHCDGRDNIVCGDNAKDEL